MSARALPALAIAGFLFGLFAPSDVRATVMVELSLDELIQEADAIVHAVVVRSEVHERPFRGRPELFTATTLEVRRWLKGRGGAHVVIDELGGVLADRGSAVAGTPRYGVRDEVIVFLRRRADGTLVTFGMSQGKFIVRRGVRGVAPIVRRDLDGLAFAHWNDAAMQVSEPSSQPSALLDAFIARIVRASGQPRSSEVVR